jgi:rare lipoprotein A
MAAATMDGNTTMTARAAVAAIALLALGGSISGLHAAEEAAVAPVAQAAAEDDAALPRFVPLDETLDSDVAEERVDLAVETGIDDEDAEVIGVASWYGSRFAGRRTASGERFDPSEFTAAHRTLPFGTRVRVTNAAGKSVVVRINDRGPFHGGRVIDLSQAAAAELGLVRAGSGRVELARLD